MTQANPFKVQLTPSWEAHLKDELTAQYFRQLKEFLLQEYQKFEVYPPQEEVFSAFHHTPFEKVKVVIIGQDPYHGPNQANGLCFSVNKGVKLPPSLVNIYKEIKADLGFDPSQKGDLSHWAKQGVLLLNSCLTVRKGEAGSHHNQGWERFTDAVLKKLNQKKEGLVFLLWGRQAQTKESLLSDKQFVLKAAHPSPLSAYKGFLGCQHFSKTNQILTSIGKKPIDWQIS